MTCGKCTMIAPGLALALLMACGSEDSEPKSGTDASAGSGGTGASSSGGSSGAGGGIDAGGTSATGGNAGSDASTECVPGTKQCTGTTPQTCDVSGKWTSGTPCPFVCAAGACSGVCTPGSKQCNGATPESCDAAGAWQDGAACPEGCEAGACKTAACKTGEFNCYGNQVQACDPGPPAKWIPKSPALSCDPTAGQACKKATGTCETLTPLAVPSAIGNCYVYATFATGGGAFKGGYGVASFGDKIYVKRGDSTDQYVDVYQVTLQDTDFDGKLEPEQHPQNPQAVGPIEQRTLTFITSYSKAADKVPLGGFISELQAKSDRLFVLGPTDDGTVTEWLFATQATNAVAGVGAVATDGGIAPSVVPWGLGYGQADGLWYLSTYPSALPHDDRVLSWHAPTSEWVLEFQRPAATTTEMMRGLEVLVAPKTGQQFVYVSTAYSAAIDQYRRDPQGWVPVTRFTYDPAGGGVALAFGALDHFWLVGGASLPLYEVGGGDCAQYLK